MLSLLVELSIHMLGKMSNDPHAELYAMLFIGALIWLVEKKK